MPSFPNMQDGNITQPAVGGYVTGPVVGLFVGVVVVGVIIFYGAKYVRAKQGLDLKYIYSSIPPE